MFKKPSFDRGLLYFVIGMVIFTILTWFLDPRPTDIKMQALQAAADAEQGIIGIIMLPITILVVMVVGLILAWRETHGKGLAPPRSK